MTSLQAFREALEAQEAIVSEQRVPERHVDALGRPRMSCCGALDLGDSDHGGRPFQCACQLELFRDEREAAA